MREIKFRAWNAGNNEWLRNDDLILFLDGSVAVFGNKPLSCNNFPKYYPLITLMQYTGLKDKDGKEAYHKDIVKYKDDSRTPQVGVVEWSDVAAKFFIEAINGDDEGNQDGELMYLEFEVIGNIYENPELLGGTQKAKVKNDE